MSWTGWNEARAISVDDVVNAFDLDKDTIVAREFKGVLDFSPFRWSSDPSVLDEHGNGVRVEFIACHSARPDSTQMYMNDLVFGMPKPPPWVWQNDAPIFVSWISAWSGERCVATSFVGERHLEDGRFQVEWVRGRGDCKFQPAPMPDRMRR